MENIMDIWRDVSVEYVRRADLPDLSGRQWAIMMLLYYGPGIRSVQELSRELSIPKPAVSRALDALSVRDLIKRTRDPKDKRVVIVRRTADGDLFLRRFKALWSEKATTQFLVT